MKEMRRLLSFLLVLVMVIGFVPANAFAAEVSVDFTGSSNSAVDYLFFATDRHENTTIIGNLLNQMGASKIEYVGLGGDMVGDGGGDNPEYDVKDVLDEVTAAAPQLNNETVDLVYASGHDQGAIDPYETGIMNWTSGQLHEGDHYYVYGVIEDDVKSASKAQSAASAFVAWATNTDGDGKDIDTSKVIIVLSHFPLHAKRGDNVGAGYWHNALNTVATGSATGSDIVRDVVFFHGHNHSQESTTYLKAPKSSLSIESYVTPSETMAASLELETFTMQVFDPELELQEGMTTNATASGTTATIYYTYATAGYLNAQSKATMVTVTEDTLSLQEYSTSGATSNSLSLDRVETAAAAVPTQLIVNGTDAYTVGDTYVAPTVSVKYENVEEPVALTADQYTVDGTVDTSTAGTYTLTYSCTLNGYAATAEFTVTVKEAETEPTTESTTEATEAPKVIDYVMINEGDGAAYAQGDKLMFQLLVTYTPYATEKVTQDVCEVVSVTNTETNEVVTLDTAMSTVGKYSAVVAYQGEEATTPLTFTVSEKEDFEGGVTSYDTLSLLFGDTVTLTADVKNVTEDETVVSAMATVQGVSDFVAYDISATLAEGETATVSIPVPTEWVEGELTVYYITDEGTVSDETFEVSYADGYVTFTTNHFSTYVVGNLQGETTVTYKLVETLTSGNEYLIVNTNEASTSAYALGASSAGVSVTVSTDGDNKVITAPGSAIVWTASGSGNNWSFENSASSGAYLGYTQGGSWQSYSYSVNCADSERTWTLSNNNLYINLRTNAIYGSDDFYLTDGSTWSMSTTSDTVYFYEKVETPSTGATVELTVNKDVVDLLVGKNETLTTTVKVGGTATTNYKITWASTNTGVATVENGTITAVGAGTTTITATLTEANDTAVNGTVQVVITVNVTTATVNSISVTLPEGGITGCTHKEADFSGVTITAAMSDSSTMTIDPADVEFTYNNVAGEQTVTATYSGKTTTFTITVMEEAVASTAVTPAEFTIRKDITPNFTGLTYTKTFNCGCTEDITEGLTVTGFDNTAVGTYENCPVMLNDEQVGTVTVEVVEGEPEYVLEIVDENGRVIDWVTSLEKIGEGSTHQLGVQLTRDGETWTPESVEYVTYAKRTSTTDPFVPSKGILYWTVNDDAIVTKIENGEVTFTGEKDGLVNISVYYCGTDATLWQTDSITVAVTSKDFYTDTSDKTNFPEYPDEGSININKTATAIGNFSETGIAQVELYGNGVPVGGAIDVYLMLDLSNSVYNAGLNDEVFNAAVAFAGAITDNCTNNNRIAVGWFSSSASTVISFEESETMTWTTMQSTITGISKPTSGTSYTAALTEVKSVLDAERTDGTFNPQYIVFISDGAPTSFTYVNGSSTSVFTKNGQPDDSDVSSLTSKDEYYTTTMKGYEDPVTVYTIGLNLNTDDNPNALQILQNIATDSEKYANVESGQSTADMEESLKEILKKFAGEIKQAASDVTVYDQITNEYELIFDFPSALTENGRVNPIPDQEFYVEVINYDLDSSYNRTGTYDTLIRIYIDNSDTDGDAKGAYYYKDGTKTFYTAYNSETNPTGVTVTFNTDGSVGAIVCQYFTYNAATKSFTWTTDKLGKDNQIALRYFVYLTNSLEYLYDDDDSTNVPAQPYDTNTIAWIEYKNHLDHLCRQEFPVPQLTWNGAQVTYYFYLVNEKGIPINSAGQEISFTNAIEVTDRYIHSVVWNRETGIGESELFVEYLAADILPAYYVLYDPTASYTIHVYEDETGKDLGNHFIIAGNKAINGDDDGVTTDKDYTTKVFMDKSSTKYDVPGTYTADGKNDTTKVFTGFDFADTTVAFAVMFAPSLQEDVVVVDFGLDVVVDVTANDKVDTIANKITLNGVSAEKYASVVMNNGVSYSSNFATKDPVAKKNLTISVESAANGTVRVKQTSMEFAEPVTFYYDAAVTFSNDTTGYMYSAITVIPATTVYYEDEFVDLTTYSNKRYEEVTYTSESDATLTYYSKSGAVYTKVDADKLVENATYYVLKYDETAGWPTNSVAANATQAVDRPGTAEITGVVDANNAYGYDAAYSACSEYSMGSAAKISVNANQYGTAEFSFYGTGFDIISMTSNTTGTLILQVYDSTGALYKTASVDTYYGYTYGIYEVTYTLNEDGKWEQTAIGEALPADSTEKVYDSKDELTKEKRTENEDGSVTATGYIKVWKAVENDPNALYQVPVMKISGLGYGKYTAKISALYYSSLDHTTGTDGYDLYLDAIRIYDPAGTNKEANDAYIKDGEGYPQYIELRNQVIQDSGATVEKISMGRYQVTLDKTTGAMFIDSDPANTSIGDYIEYGPNNELYLAKGQSVAFNLNLDSFNGTVADVQVGMKLANGSVANYAIWNATDTTDVTEGSLLTATEMYYSILDKANGTIVIKNNSSEDCIMSITNIKITFTQNPGAVSTANILYVDGESVTNAVNSMAYVEVSKPTFDPDAMDITFNRTTAEVGNNIVVTVTTSDDVQNLLVNGKVATNKSTSYLTGETIWSFTVPVEDNGSLKVTVVGFDANGEYTVPYSESVAVINQSGTAEDLLGKLFG